MNETKLPEIGNLQEITPETFEQYVQYVAQMRHAQRRFFTFRKADALETSKRMEAALDKFNEMLMDKTPKLF